MNAPIRLLLIDDDAGDIKIMTRAVERSGLDAVCTTAADLEAALAACAAGSFDCAIVDYLLPGQDGLAALAVLGQRYPFLCLIMSTGSGDEVVATEAMKGGAVDYIRKADVNPVSLRRVVENAVEKTGLRRKIEEQRKELERFADVLVHDLRAPSSSIQTFLHYIEEDLREGKMEMVAQYCEFALKAAGRMDTLIATLFQYTRLDGEVVFEPVAMNAVVESAIANLYERIQARGAVVTHGDLPMVTGSTPLLEQLVQNLVGNGIKYCKREVPELHLDARKQEDGMWLFSVKDNGIGIAPEDQQRIFESFTRLHGVGEYEGTGLGLATCSKIVARHGGTIWCDSVARAEKREGAPGTVFFFTLKPAGAAGGTGAPDTVAAGPFRQRAA